jgi:hypothetical protein
LSLAGRMENQSTQEKTEAYKNNVLVITLGYFGSGLSVKEAAQNCLKAGSPRTLKACVVVASKPVRFVDALFVEYPEGTPDFVTEFTVSKLSALL